VQGHFRLKSRAGKQRKIVTNALAIFFDAQQPGGGGLIGMLPLLLIIPLLYLMLFRPQQKRQKQWQEMLANLKQGDKVTTAGGIRGVILSIKDDAIIIRVAPDNLKMEVAKTAIAAVTREDEGAEEKK
jgi:preprotein translocase subunit YajC